VSSTFASPSAVSLLVICKANECRSVYAVDRFRESSVFAAFETLSAGVGAFPGSPQCPESITDSSIAHQSQQVTSEDIQKANLVLTMEREQKSRIAELSPAARSRTFTLTEAVHLSESLLELHSAEDSEFKLQFPIGWENSSPRDRFIWLISQLDEVRSFVEPGKWEVNDAHGVDAATHPETLSKIQEQVNRINEVFISDVLQLKLGSV
jgi:protein-tyrosine phosphatase